MIYLIKCMWTMVLVILLFCVGILIADREALYESNLILEIEIQDDVSVFTEDIQYIVCNAEVAGQISQMACSCYDGAGCKEIDKAWYAGDKIVPAGIYRFLPLVIHGEDTDVLEFLKVVKNDECATLGEFHYYLLSCIGYLENIVFQ